MRTETILKIHNTLVLPTFLYGSENWTSTALKRWRIEAAEMKLLRPLAGYTLYDHRTNDYIRRELRITGILDKIDEYRRNWLSHLQRMPQNRIPLKSYYCRPQGRRTRIKGSNPWCLWWWWWWRWWWYRYVNNSLNYSRHMTVRKEITHFYLYLTLNTSCYQISF